MNRQLPNVQAGFRKGRGTRDQIANICCIIEKAREFQKNIYFCFIDYAKAFDSVDHSNCPPNPAHLIKVYKETDISPSTLVIRFTGNNYLIVSMWILFLSDIINSLKTWTMHCFFLCIFPQCWNHGHCWITFLFLVWLQDLSEWGPGYELLKDMEVLRDTQVDYSTLATISAVQ